MNEGSNDNDSEFSTSNTGSESWRLMSMPLRRRGYLRGMAACAGISAISTGLVTGDEDGYGLGGYGHGPYGNPSDVRIAVDTHEASEVSETRAVLQGELVTIDGMEFVSCYFRWGQSGDLSDETSRTRIEHPGTFSSELSGLTENTTYEFQAVASTGNSNIPGRTFTFETARAGIERGIAPVRDGEDSVPATPLTNNDN